MLKGRKTVARDSLEPGEDHGVIERGTELGVDDRGTEERGTIPPCAH